MFIHLGGDTLVSSKEIIAILNAEQVNQSNSVAEYQKKGTGKTPVIAVDEETYKSIVITDKLIYLSPISSLTLKKRAGFVAEL